MSRAIFNWNTKKVSAFQFFCKKEPKINHPPGKSEKMVYRFHGQNKEKTFFDTGLTAICLPSGTPPELVADRILRSAPRFRAVPPKTEYRSQ